jgi:hypothetical protein
LNPIEFEFERALLTKDQPKGGAFETKISYTNRPCCITLKSFSSGMKTG